MPQFRPLLAGRLEGNECLKSLNYPVCISAKFDGVRAIIINGRVMSRKLIEIPNKKVQKTFGCPEFNGFDGELISGDPTSPDCYRTTQSITSRAEGEGNVTFHVFDDVSSPSQPFKIRLKGLLDRLNNPSAYLGDGYQVVVVPQYLCDSAEEVIGFEKAFLNSGFEGIMIRSREGKYKYGRSTESEQILLKLKRFVDSEAEILEVIEGERNENEAVKDGLGLTKRSSHQENKVKNGTMGALRVRDVNNGVEFNIGTGFTAAMCDAFWSNRSGLVGKVVKYKYQSVGAKDKPRFPVWLGLRDKWDM